MFVIHVFLDSEALFFSFKLNAALTGRKDLFENVNIDWDLIAVSISV